MQSTLRNLVTTAVMSTALVGGLTVSAGAATTASSPAAATVSAAAKTTVKTVYTRKTVKNRVVRKSHRWMWAGTTKVSIRGHVGVKSQTWRYTYVNGKYDHRWLKAQRYLKRPKTTYILVGVKKRPTQQVPYGVWDRLAQCESGQNWSINTGNGYYGGLQFLLSTWRALGAPGYPHQYSRETQIKYAEKLRRQVGSYRPWPACARRLGLPT